MVLREEEYRAHHRNHPNQVDGCSCREHDHVRQTMGRLEAAGAQPCVDDLLVDAGQHQSAYREHKGQRSSSEERCDEHEHEDLDDQMVIPGHPLEDRDDGEESATVSARPAMPGTLEQSSQTPAGLQPQEQGRQIPARSADGCPGCSSHAGQLPAMSGSID